MHRNRTQDPRRKGNGSEPRVDGQNVHSSGDWFPLPNRETFQIPELEVKRETSRTALNSEEDIKAGLLSDDEFSHISFPTIGFCDYISKHQGVPVRRPQIVDLCREDKQRIAKLVKEISKCHEEQQEKTAQIKTLTEENTELKNKIGKLEKEMYTLKTTLKYRDDNLKMLSKSFNAKELGLKKENSDLQLKMSTLIDEKSSLQLKIEEERKQMEQLTRAIYNVSIENKMINKKYDHTKEKLKVALEAVSKIESDLDQKQLQRENKSSQTDLPHVKVLTPRQSRDRRIDDVRFHRGSSWKYEHCSRESSDEDSLISELFFIPKQKNLHKLQYTSDDEFY